MTVAPSGHTIQENKKNHWDFFQLVCQTSTDVFQTGQMMHTPGSTSLASSIRLETAPKPTIGIREDRTAPRTAARKALS